MTVSYQPMSRGPTPFEQYQICRKVNNYYPNFNVTASYNHRVSKEALSEALSRIIAGNSQFRVNFYRTDGNKLDKFILKGIKTIKFEDVVIYKKGPLDENALFELDHISPKLDTDVPLWRLVVYETETEQTFTILYDHTLFDGASGVFFHEDLIKELSEINNPLFKSFLYQQKTDDADLPLNQELEAVFNAGILFTAATIVSELFVPVWIKKWVSVWSNWWNPLKVNLTKEPQFQYKVAQQGTETKFKIINVPPEKLTNIIKWNKQNKVSMNSYVSVVGAQCLQETIIKRAQQENASVTLIVAINARRCVKTPIRYGLAVGGYFGRMPHLPKAKKDLLKYIRYFGQDVQSYMTSGIAFSSVGCLRLVDIASFFKEKLGIHSRDTIDISNLGNVSITSKDWKVNNLVFSQSNCITRHFGLSFVSTPEGGMNIVFGYLADFDDFPGSADEFADLFSQRLVEFD